MKKKYCILTYHGRKHNIWLRVVGDYLSIPYRPSPHHRFYDVQSYFVAIINFFGCVSLFPYLSSNFPSQLGQKGSVFKGLLGGQR